MHYGPYTAYIFTPNDSKIHPLDVESVTKAPQIGFSDFVEITTTDNRVFLIHPTNVIFLRNKRNSAD